VALGRFAALYADTVLIRDPFEKVLYEEDSPKLRIDFASTIAVLNVLRPVIEAGRVSFAPTVLPLCEQGLKELRRAEEIIETQVLAACDALIDDVVEHLDVQLLTKKEYPYLSIRGTEKYVPHSTIDVIPLNGEGRWAGGVSPTPDEVRDAVQTWILDPAVRDLQYRALMSGLYNVRYLTDRPVDAELLYLLDAGPRAAQKPFLSAQVSHSLPFVDGLDTETLLKLRSEEGEAFQVYRDKVRALAENSDLSAKEFQEAFRDLVQPELNRIDHAVAAARKMVKDSIREKLVFGTGLVTVGLAAGAVVPAAGAIISAMGGTKFGSDLLTGLNALVREPEAARKNDFYFLWKARDLAKNRAASRVGKRRPRGQAPET
jgi:hypothetical protein